MIRKNIVESRSRNLTKISLQINNRINFQDNLMIEAIDNKPKTHKKNTKSDIGSLGTNFPMVFKTNGSNTQTKDKQKSRIGMNSEIINTMNTEDLKSLADLRKTFNQQALNDKLNTPHGAGLIKRIKLKKYNDSKN